MYIVHVCNNFDIAGTGLDRELRLLWQFENITTSFTDSIISALAYSTQHIVFLIMIRVSSIFDITITCSLCLLLMAPLCVHVHLHLHVYVL